MRCFAYFSTYEAAGYQIARYLGKVGIGLAAGSRLAHGDSNTIGKIGIRDSCTVTNVQ